MNVQARDFLSVLGAALAPEERLILCGFPGDPGTAPPTAWRPRPWITGREGLSMPADWNAYVTVGAFARAPDGSFRRRAAGCTGGFALMVDDVGTKVPRETVSVLEPTARIETSPGNEQWWYVLGEPERDPVRFDAIIRAFIEGKLLGHDPGMASVTRVGRLPGYRNGKSAYGPQGAAVTTLSLEPGRLFTVDQLLAEFDLQLVGRREPPRWQRVLPEDVEARIAGFTPVEVFLRVNGMFKTEDYDPSGWREIRCPWVEEHTGGVDNGAAIREPHEDNGWYGAFRCHHGSHEGCGWRELTDWVMEEAAEQLAETQARAAAMFEETMKAQGKLNHE